MNIRLARAGDADRVLELMEALTRPPVSDDPAPQRAVFLQHLEADDACVFVAEEDGEIAGAASLCVRPRLNWTTPEGWIPDLFVDPRFRRRGAARALLDACAMEGRRRGCHRLILESGHHRAEAHRLYESYGFDHFGRAYNFTL